jgi:4-methyl-5(b-hydroxyethyl)-thiazole monophosphate biosynthesis
VAQIITILAEGFEEIEAVSFIDLIRRANISITLLGLGTTTVTGAHGITLTADGILESYHGSYDGVILPGGGPGTRNLLNSPRVIDLVQDAYKRGLLCAAVCAAPGVFGKAGILKGKNAACYPGCEDTCTGATILKDPVVIDGNIITSRGIGTSLSFALEIISWLSDTRTAENIAKQIIYNWKSCSA